MAQAAAQTTKQNNKKKGGAAQPQVKLNFTELDDLFLNTKGKALRNLRKKMEKYRELEKQVKKGEVQPNDQQKSQIQSIPQLKGELDDLEALCKLYMDSNPNYDKKANVKAEASEEDIAKVVASTLDIVGKGVQLTALMQEDAYFVECTEAQRASIMEISRKYKLMNDVAQKGSVDFTNTNKIEDFVTEFAKLATSSHDIIKGSCSYHELNRFINGCFDDNAQILSRIEEKNQEKQREREAAEAEAAKVAAAKEANQDEEIAAALGDELDAFDVFDDDYGAETAAPAKKAEPAKPAEAPKKEAAAAATTDNTQQPKGQDAAGGDAGAEEAKDVQFAIGGEGGDAPANQDGGNQRGGGDRGRGGRRDYNNRQGRGGYDNRGRGDRRNNNYRGGRGGYNRGPVEDEDGFVVETGEKPKPRGNRGYGNRGGGRRDGNRGGGEFRGRGGGDRNNDRGGRGRGGRPQTSDGGAGDVAGAQQQPREIGAQSNTTDQGQV